MQGKAFRVFGACALLSRNVSYFRTHCLAINPECVEVGAWGGMRRWGGEMSKSQVSVLEVNPGAG